MEDKIELANKIFADISKKLLPGEKGKIVAIDPQTGKYALGSTELEAYKKMWKNCTGSFTVFNTQEIWSKFLRVAKEHPKKQFVFKRLGFASTYFVGAF